MRPIGNVISALDNGADGIITVIRNWIGDSRPNVATAAAALRSRVKSVLPAENVIELEVEFKSSTSTSSSNGINSDHHPSHENYLSKLRQGVLDGIQTLVNASVERDPEIKSRKKMVQEVYAESLLHLSLLQGVRPMEESDPAIAKVKQLFLSGM